MVEISVATSPADIAVARMLIGEYACSLDLDLSFQDYDREIATLPGEYAPPNGVLLIAREGSDPLGCVALRPFDWPRTAELKRLYVRPAGRGQHLGTRLSEEALAHARRIGYRRVRLDTLPTMPAALRVYESLGFHDIPPYRYNTVSNARYLELDLETGDYRAQAPRE